MTAGFLFAAAGLETTENASAAIDFQSALMLVMVVCLAFMAKALADLSRRIGDLTARHPAAAPGGASPIGRAGAPAADGAMSRETLAAITAAVYAVVDQPVRIVAVDEVSVGQARDWSLEGRRQIFTSHRVR